MSPDNHQPTKSPLESTLPSLEEWKAGDPITFLSYSSRTFTSFDENRLTMMAWCTYAEVDAKLSAVQGDVDLFFLKQLPPPYIPPPERASPSTSIGGTTETTPASSPRPPAIVTYEGGYTDLDVLMGRGSKSNHHPGNLAYLDEKERMYDRYVSAKRSDRFAISEELVAWVHDRGGRFMQRNPDGDGLWHEVDDNRARDKASQTLREKRKGPLPVRKTT